MSVIESVFRTNAFGPLILTQALLSNLTAVPNSRIRNITSRAGSIADNTGGNFYAYRSSKAALNMIGKSMAVDLKEKGVLVAMLHPGMVATPGSGAKIGQPQASNRAAGVGGQVLGRAFKDRDRGYGEVSA
jgi:NAD(P)-dependent dehydrogenase (short-subunit alcohol dehydrogenase family)